MRLFSQCPTTEFFNFAGTESFSCQRSAASLTDAIKIIERIAQIVNNFINDTLSQEKSRDLLCRGFLNWYSRVPVSPLQFAPLLRGSLRQFSAYNERIIIR